MFNQFQTGIHRRASSVRLSEIVSDVSVVQMSGPVDTEIAGITTDSRLVRDRWLFVATEGEHTDGHRFVQSAIEQGAGAVVVQVGQYRGELKSLLNAAYAQHHATAVLVVRDSRVAVAVLADRFYGSPASRLRLVGITGTNGKTTTGYLIKSILEAAGETVGLIGTVEYHIGNTVVPATFTTPPAEELHRVLRDMSAAGCTSVVMEVSSHALALGRVHGLLFDVTLFTNLTQDHLDFHHSMEEYRDAKSLLFRKHTRRWGIINADDPAAGAMGTPLRQKRRTFGRAKRAAFRIDHVTSTQKGLTVHVTTSGRSIVLRSGLLGLFNAYNITGAFAAGVMLGIEDSVIARGIRRVKAVPGRFERIQSRLGVLAVVDYSHTPDALAKAIEAARLLTAKNGRVFTVFGCGGDRDPGKRPLMGDVAVRLSDVVVVTSDNPRNEDPDAIIDDILQGVPQEMSVLRNTKRKAAIELALNQARKGDVVLVAGKGHETYQIIGSTRAHFDDREVIKTYFTATQGGVA